MNGRSRTKCEKDLVSNLQCCRCHHGLESYVRFYPTSPRGTEGQEWVCENCLTPEERIRLLHEGKIYKGSV